MGKVPYASIIGSVMYVMICTRPDLAHAVSITQHIHEQSGKGALASLKVDVEVSWRYQ